MTTPQTTPFGCWPSPITSSSIVTDTMRLGAIALDGPAIYWSESRPSEGGRSVVVRLDADGIVSEVTPAPFNVRTRVHEYGGGAFTVAAGTVYASNFVDGQLYAHTDGSPPRALTSSGSDLRYADLVLDVARARLIAVREDHTAGEPVNAIVGVALEGGTTGTMLVGGNDFYASPRLNPAGTHLAWLTWNHPHMPWDGCDLWVGRVTADGTVVEAQHVAGGVEESIFQPCWSPAGVLHFVSDRTGWWNLYRWRDGAIESLHPAEAEFGQPQWVFGQSMYAFTGPTRLICSWISDGHSFLGSLDTERGTLTPIETPYTVIEGLHATERYAVFSAASPRQSAVLVRLDLQSGQQTVLRRSSLPEPDPGYLSVSQPITFPTEEGLEAHAFYYPPTNRDVQAPDGERPPLLVGSHGGPTGMTTDALDLEVQFWTSRGFAVLDVNYGGSTGYGRAYRQRLNGRWGIVDVDDCVNAARYLVDRGLADPARLAIHGGSAGGYTTLAVLTFRNIFQAGASYYGVSDLEALARETHKFESRYLDSMIGPYPQERDLYRARSPLYAIDRLHCPIIFLQGLDDRVVPPNQAESMVEALRSKGIPVAYLAFEGEGHGFRRADSLQRALDAELTFYARIFGFRAAQALTPLEIFNLPEEG